MNKPEFLKSQVSSVFKARYGNFIGGMIQIATLRSAVRSRLGAVLSFAAQPSLAVHEIPGRRHRQWSAGSAGEALWQVDLARTSDILKLASKT
jgi:hypothetical protein